jgi:hypothetical protein
MKKRMAVRYMVQLLAVGLLIAATVKIVHQKTVGDFANNQPYINLGEELMIRSTKGHLNLEEALAGDESIDYEKDIKPMFTATRDVLQKAYDGNDEYTMTDEEIKAILKQAIVQTDNLITVADKTWDFKKHGAPIERDSTGAIIGEDVTAKLELEFDAEYNELQTTLDQLVQRIQPEIKSNFALAGIMSWALSGIVALIFGGLAFLAYKILDKQESAIILGDTKLQEESKRVERLSNFIEAVSTGNYAIDIDSTDELSNKLISMRDTLKSNAEEDNRRNWATSGLAQIGEILRSSDNTKELYDNIITFVVKYVNNNQGGLFLVNEDNDQDPYLELVSCYAFERKKFIQKRVEFGQGLVGQCYLEGARIHLKTIPEGYVHITSGLGGANPNSLLVIPMKVNDKTYGVIELASFRKYEEHEIVLVEKFAESIGAAVSSVKINESTRILLEKTQQQAEEMRSQEEEMRQNMEELSATQEEMLRKEREYVNRIQDLEEQVGVTSRV